MLDNLVEEVTLEIGEVEVEVKLEALTAEKGAIAEIFESPGVEDLPI